MSSNYHKYADFSPSRKTVYREVKYPDSHSKLFPLGSGSKNVQELTQEAPLGYIDETGAYRTNVNSHGRYMSNIRRREAPGAQETFVVSQRPRVSQNGLILTQEPMDVSPARVIVQNPGNQKVYATSDGKYLIEQAAPIQHVREVYNGVPTRYVSAAQPLNLISSPNRVTVSPARQPIPYSPMRQVVYTPVRNVGYSPIRQVAVTESKNIVYSPVPVHHQSPLRTVIVNDSPQRIKAQNSVFAMTTNKKPRAGELEEESFLVKKFESLPPYRNHPTIAKTLLAPENNMPLKPLAKTLVGLTTNANIDSAHLVLSVSRLIANQGRNVRPDRHETEDDPFNNLTKKQREVCGGLVDRYLEIDRRRREEEARAVEEFLDNMLDSMGEQMEYYKGFNAPNLRTMDKEGRRIVNEFLDVGSARRREIELGKRGPGVGVGPEESRWYSDHLTDDQILEMETRDLARISKPSNLVEVMSEIDHLALQEQSYNQGFNSQFGSINESIRRERQREHESLLKHSRTSRNMSSRSVNRPHQYSRQETVQTVTDQAVYEEYEDLTPKGNIEISFNPNQIVKHTSVQHSDYNEHTPTRRTSPKQTIVTETTEIIEGDSIIPDTKVVEETTTIVTSTVQQPKVVPQTQKVITTTEEIIPHRGQVVQKTIVETQEIQRDSPMKDELKAIANVVRQSKIKERVIEQNQVVRTSPNKTVTTIEEVTEELIDLRPDEEEADNDNLLLNGEKSEAFIRDQNTYFLQYTKEQMQDITILNGNRLRLNKPGTQLLLTGLKGSITFDVTEDIEEPLKIREEYRSDARGVMLYTGDHAENMIIQTPNSNNLRLVDKHLDEIKMIKGNFKPGTEYGEFDHFISSMCDTHILVSKGLGSVSLVDTTSLREIGEIEHFFELNGKPTRPFATISNQDFTKILGASLTEDNQYCLHYLELNAPLDGDFTKVVKKNDLVKNFIPINPEIKAMEVSQSGKYIYLGAFNPDTRQTEILVAKFDSSLEIVSSYNVGFQKHAKPRRIKRIKGYNILIIGLRKNLVMVEYNERSGRFTLLKELEKVCRSDIVDFEFRDGVLYVKGYQEDYISVVNFNINLDEFKLSEKTDYERYGVKQVSPKKVMKTTKTVTTEDINSGVAQAMKKKGKVIQTVEIIEEITEVTEENTQHSSEDTLILAQSGIFSPEGNRVRRGKIFTGVFGTEKIAVAKDKRRIYIGGDGLNVMQTTGRGTKSSPEYELLPSNSKLKSKFNKN